MKTISVEYLGGLRTKATHLRSGNTLITDAPVDNNGKGESFSPTDLVATASLTCMFTIMGITARNHDLEYGNLSGEVLKVMESGPRRVSALQVEIAMTGHNLNDYGKKLMETAALSCPVVKSIHPDIQLTVKFRYE